ncbi:UNVERIFIED_CONTAM: hypothetical protein GTU68_045844 [Idotea baltica]|nr:hypothetical protein [Idotea baltica]
MLVDWLKTLPLYPLPHHLISRVVLWLTRKESSLTVPVIKRFAKMFDVDMLDAVEPSLDNYKTFNAFFTRELKADARPIASGEREIACPADGRISAIGNIEEGRIFQAKNQDYSLQALLGGDEAAAKRLHNGKFATIYLSPRDYHRLHMPLSGKLIKQVHVPGRLFSVGPHTVRTLKNLFARNERVVAQFETDAGLMALVLVGAINVAAIETVWHGLVTPPKGKRISRVDYDASDAVSLERGDEMGRFNMGSTIIVLLEKDATWRVDMQSGDSVKMGQFLGQRAS